MKFRPVREFLDESMAEVKDIPPTRKAIAELTGKLEREIRLEYLLFDERINWDTYLVCDSKGVIGYSNANVES